MNFYRQGIYSKLCFEFNYRGCFLYNVSEIFFRIGTKNASTYKVICLHLDSLLPPTALELNIPCTSQIASIISLGFLFFETFDMHIIKVLLQEIGRPAGPEMENSTDRESHALAAGLALGMIMIGVSF